MVGVVQCDRSSEVKGLTKAGMDEPSFCNLSLAVDCTLSLGSTTTTTRPDNHPARQLSPDQWSLSVRSERGDDNLSWGGSCNRSDSDASPGYYPQVSERVAAKGDRRGFKTWPRSPQASPTSKALFSVIEDHHKYSSSRTSRQPWLMSSYLPSRAAVEAKASSRVKQCVQEEEDSSFVRVCAHCGTSKTPLWRNGPGGPKSLCNACGIRFKKAGRRSAANESQASPPVLTKVAKRKLNGEQRRQGWVFPADAKPRKRSRASAFRGASDSFLSCMTWQSSLSGYDIRGGEGGSPRQQQQQQQHRLASPLSDEDQLNLELGSFSSDSEEGAVLLMALSCGMVNA